HEELMAVKGNYWSLYTGTEEIAETV
ncbi:MAG: hypothetical protein ACI959_001813, partial [Limisphaerales bacterium]